MNPKLRKFLEFCKDFSSNKVALVAFFIFLLILFVAIFAPLVSPTDPYDLNTVSIMNSRLPPFSEDFSGNYFLLGTDGAGRDMVSAIFYGLRVSLGVGVLSGIFALIIGSFFGISAAFFGGRYESLIMRIVDIQLSFPSILVALIILAAFGKGVEKTIIALILVQWAYYARTARSSALVATIKSFLSFAEITLSISLSIAIFFMPIIFLDPLVSAASDPQKSLCSLPGDNDWRKVDTTISKSKVSNLC